MINSMAIKGCGLAGVFLGWRLWQRGVSFHFEGERGVGASKAAAGLVNLVTGKGINASWRLEEFLEEMKSFHHNVGSILGRNYFQEKPVLRVFSSDKEREKFESKRTQLAPWINDVHSVLPDVKGGQWGGVEWHSGGWLDVQGFVSDSLEFFEKEQSPVPPEHDVTVFCEGAKGLAKGPFSFLPKRLAKGQILEVEVPNWNEQRILNRNGWCIPIGQDRYRVGATYEWEDLSSGITSEGQAELENLVDQFTDLPFEILNHVAGVRPIVRTSQPVMGKHPREENVFVFNGLGSKGCLYGPKAAKHLVSHMLDGEALDPELDVAAFAEG